MHLERILLHRIQQLLQVVCMPGINKLEIGSVVLNDQVLHPTPLTHNIVWWVLHGVDKVGDMVADMVANMVANMVAHIVDDQEVYKIMNKVTQDVRE